MSLAAHILDYVLGKIFEIGKESLRFKDEFLEYDVTALLRSYSDQHGRFSEQIPYADVDFNPNLTPHFNPILTPPIAV